MSSGCRTISCLGSLAVFFLLESVSLVVFLLFFFLFLFLFFLFLLFLSCRTSSSLSLAVFFILEYLSLVVFQDWVVLWQSVEGLYVPLLHTVQCQGWVSADSVCPGAVSGLSQWLQVVLVLIMKRREAESWGSRKVWASGLFGEREPGQEGESWLGIIAGLGQSQECVECLRKVTAW